MSDFWVDHERDMRDLEYRAVFTRTLEELFGGLTAGQSCDALAEDPPAELHAHGYDDCWRCGGCDACGTCDCATRARGGEAEIARGDLK